MPADNSSSRDPRPEFMITLGLAPPYAKEDVKQAYFEKAKQAHPDRGGTTAAFHLVHQAFEQAQAYVEFRTDRRAWIAANMGRYIALEEAAARLERLGATVVTAAPPWLHHSFGDFSQLAETPALVRAHDADNGDEIIDAMVDQYSPLRDLPEIDLSGCRVSDDAVLRLSVFQQLKQLNLSRTPVSGHALAVVDQIPALRTLGIDGVALSWWSRRRLAAKLRKRDRG